MKENEFQAHVIRRLKQEYEGCIVIKQDPDYMQGIPDLIILWRDRWAMLEVKASADAPDRPNQPYYIDMFNNMSFARFIYPENEEQVFDELQQAFEPRR
jgi:hypothetical protein